MPKTQGKAKRATQIRKADPPELQYAKLNEEEQIVVFYYLDNLHTKEETHKKGWDIDRAGCADHWNHFEAIKEYWPDYKAFYNRARVRNAVIVLMIVNLYLFILNNDNPPPFVLLPAEHIHMKRDLL